MDVHLQNFQGLSRYQNAAFYRTTFHSIILIATHFVLEK